VARILIDHPFYTMAGVAILSIGLAVLLHRVVVQEKFASVAVTILIAVLVTIPMTHLFALSRDREQRQIALRQAHLDRLRSVLRADSQKLSELAKQVSTQARLTRGRVDETSSTVPREVQKYFHHDILTTDLANHVSDYSKRREQLRADIEQHETTDQQAVQRIMQALPPLSAHREEVARALSWKCRGLPGMTLEVTDGGYNYSWLGGGGGSSGGPPAPHAPRELVAAFKAYSAFRGSPEYQTDCEQLTISGARIVQTARMLSEEAQRLAERPTLRGDCEYTSLD
jgi:hypothetical protein